jgi:hypothetical protein
MDYEKMYPYNSYISTSLFYMGIVKDRTLLLIWMVAKLF